jgi:hypothetical protein
MLKYFKDCSMNEFQELTNQLKLELETKQQYDRGELALTSNQLSDLNALIWDLEKRRLAACTHETCQGVRETEYNTDEYGSGHTTYYIRVKCCDCEQTLLSKWRGDDYMFNWAAKTEPTTLQEACIWFDEQPGAYSSRNAKKIEDYGVRRIERKVVEYMSTRK